jgi:hypothetical protein
VGCAKFQSHNKNTPARGFRLCATESKLRAAPLVISVVMEEKKVLRKVIHRNIHSIPLGVRLWGWWKRTFIEDAGVRASEKVMSETQFRQKIRRALRRSGPIEVRGSSRTARRFERDCMGVLFRYCLALLSPDSPIQIKVSAGGRGLGLFARTKLSVRSLPKVLFGAVASLDAEDFDTLVEAGYPSLYGTSTVNGLLFGPLSLCNHSCSSPFRFSNLIHRGKPEMFEEFGIIRLKPRNVTRRQQKDLTIQSSTEILVNYGMRKKDFVCQCRACNPNP